jgi:hypothetical protein
MIRWRKSSYSAQSNCIEVARRPGAVLLRDSKDPHGPVTAFATPAWRAFVTALRRDELTEA